MTCSISGCDKPAEKRGWCQMHYRRWQRHGDPLINHRPELVIGSAHERFWSKVDRRGPDDCWEWAAWRLPGGYGHFGKGGRSGGTVLAHRYAYEMAFGPIPEGATIDHLCSNPPCVNPRHLEAVSQRVNNHRAPRIQFKVNAEKTHCPQGHPYDEANTIRRQRKDGGYSRECRACLYEAIKRSKAKKQGTPLP